jgi:hypothetical protein
MQETDDPQEQQQQQPPQPPPSTDLSFSQVLVNNFPVAKFEENKGELGEEEQITCSLMMR